jgi:isocitrate dehydrogenase
MLQEDSLHTTENLKLLREEDAEKVTLMEKPELIKYYEGLLDKCHTALLKKRETNRMNKQANLNMQF